MLNIKQNKWFTLVELIVIITIVTILWVIAILWLQWYTQNARDWTRISDMKSIQRALWLYIIQRWVFPDPSNAVNITYSWATVWTQWTFWDQTFRNVWTINKKPTDPLKYVEYSYSITNDKKDYQLSWIMESSDLTVFRDSISNKANAQSNFIRSYQIWPYNWLATRVNTWWLDYVLAIPSITTNNSNHTTIEQVYANKSFVYNNYGNLPGNFTETFKTSFRFDFVPNKLVLFSWTLTELSELSNQLILMQNIQDSYAWAMILNEDEQIKKIVETNIDPQNPSSKTKILACTLINFTVKHFVECNDIDYVTFYIINVLHIDITNLPWDTISSVIQTWDWELWFWTNWWVWHYDWTTWTIYNTWNSGLVSNTILAMAEATNWDMWFWTNLWVSIFNWTSWTTYNQQNSWLRQNHIISITTWASWTMWIWTNAWVSTYDSWVWKDYTRQNSWITHNHVNAIYEDNQWNIWFATKQWLDKYKNWVVTKYKTAQGLPANEIFYIIQDTNNNMRFWTHNWVSKYNWTTFTTKNTSNTSWWLPSNWITYIYQNETNWDLWFGTNNWAAKYVEWTNTWTVYNTSNQLSWNNIYSINQSTNWSIVIMNDWWVDTITN